MDKGVTMPVYISSVDVVCAWLLMAACKFLWCATSEVAIRESLTMDGEKKGRLTGRDGFALRMMHRARTVDWKILQICRCSSNLRVTARGQQMPIQRL